MQESDKKTSVILISKFPLPYNGIGSWTTLYNNYLAGSHLIDKIICPKPATFIKGVVYGIVKPDHFIKLRRKFNWNPFAPYFRPLKKLIRPNRKYMIQVIDNSGIVAPLNEFLTKLGVRPNCKIQYFYHGFPPMFDVEKGREFMAGIDEFVLLTNDSRRAHETCYGQSSCKFSVLYNGIDTSKFFEVSHNEKLQFRKMHTISAEIVFVWCSQDRPKKGLQIVLDAWKQLEDSTQKATLLVIGTEPKESINGVKYLGKIPNNQLPEYYQMADVFLFPTQCEEGFGMSLIEAMHCGCFCIASALGGVPEVLQYGKLGKLIENPHLVTGWVSAIQNYLNRNVDQYEFSGNQYTMESWSQNMNNLINDAKVNFEPNL